MASCAECWIGVVLGGAAQLAGGFSCQSQLDTPREERQNLKPWLNASKRDKGPPDPFIQSSAGASTEYCRVYRGLPGRPLPVESFAVFRIPGSPSLSFPTMRKGVQTLA